jgi:hypothetical protein
MLLRHQLALLEIDKKKQDAHTRQLNADLDCKNDDRSCVTKNDEIYQATIKELQKQINTEEGHYFKELAVLKYIVGNYHSCTINMESCPADIRSIITKPVKQMSCEELSTVLPSLRE